MVRIKAVLFLSVRSCTVLFLCYYCQCSLEGGAQKFGEYFSMIKGWRSLRYFWRQLSGGITQLENFEWIFFVSEGSCLVYTSAEDPQTIVQMLRSPPYRDPHVYQGFWRLTAENTVNVIYSRETRPTNFEVQRKRRTNRDYKAEIREHTFYLVRKRYTHSLLSRKIVRLRRCRVRKVSVLCPSYAPKIVRSKNCLRRRYHFH